MTLSWEKSTFFFFSNTVTKVTFSSLFTVFIKKNGSLFSMQFRFLRIPPFCSDKVIPAEGARRLCYCSAWSTLPPLIKQRWSQTDSGCGGWEHIRLSSAGGGVSGWSPGSVWGTVQDQNWKIILFAKNKLGILVKVFFLPWWKTFFTREVTQHSPSREQKDGAPPANENCSSKLKSEYWHEYILFDLCLASTNVFIFLLRKTALTFGPWNLGWGILWWLCSPTRSKWSYHRSLAQRCPVCFVLYEPVVFWQLS